ncbi:hypothetical protein B7P34_19410 [Streptosporangium nondiastaticum]|uniref:Terpene synthase n=1 Tax=Streptosporangium nondiastaticum TaxID=35764 RepID=A0A9X7JP24_9ACTN|nr:terpene synthase family protein [Streptosporangium nondiastaticum]PSJ27104.1 hypothetical protein B7P34_19410 [Streptosporangium nondiastaticum]
MNSGVQFVLPPLVLPFSQQLHSEAAEAAAHARAWAARTGLYATPQVADRAYRQLCDRFAAWVYPTAPRSRLDTLACLDLMMFLDDDHADEGAARLRPLTASPLLEVIEEPMSPVWCSRFRAHLAEWEQANVQAGFRRARSGPPPVLGEYVPWRRVSSTLIWHFDLVEYAHGFELPDDFLAGTLHHDVVDCAADVIAWTNDLFSAPKELSRGEPNNLLAVLAHHHRISLQHAAQDTADRITGRARQFLEFRAALVPAAHQGPTAEGLLLEWADHLGLWAGGNLAFCRESGRYPLRCA